MSLKVLIVATMYPTERSPGTGTFVEQIANRLSVRGHHVDLCVPPAGRAQGEVVGVRLHLWVGLKAVWMTWRRKPDVIYGHFLGPGTILPALVNRRTPIVITCHGEDVRNLGTWRLPGFSARIVAARASFIVVSRFLLEELRGHVPSVSAATPVISCGVDLKLFPLLPAPDGPTAYLCIGTLSERKNVFALAQAFDQMRGPGETLTFVGSGPDATVNKLRSYEGVVVEEAIVHEKLPALLARAHVVCQPSIREPFGLGALEGLAAGRAVVGTENGGHQEFIPRGSGIGVLVNPHNIDDIAQKLREAASYRCPNPEAREAARLHDLDLQVTRIEEVLAGLVPG